MISWSAVDVLEIQLYWKLVSHQVKKQSLLKYVKLISPARKYMYVVTILWIKKGTIIKTFLSKPF